jgi:hypothetical protein
VSRDAEAQKPDEGLIKKPATLEEIRSGAESATVQNMVRAIELLSVAEPSPAATRAARLHLLAAGLFAVAAGSAPGGATPNSEIPNPEPGGDWVM